MTCLSTSNLLVGILLCFAICVVQSDEQNSTSSNKSVPSYIVQKNQLKSCLFAEFSLSVDVTTESDSSTNTKTFDLVTTDYDGVCEESWNTLFITFNNNWSIMLNYTKNEKVYKLSSMLFNYTTDKNDLFPSDSVFRDDLSEFQAVVDSSHICMSNTPISLSQNLVLHFTNYHGQAFTNKKAFGTAVTCRNDALSSSHMVPITVGSVIGVLIILVLIAYMLGKRKHHPGYQQQQSAIFE